MRFLITAIGSMSADAAITSLREHFPQCEIIGTDIHPKEWIYLSQKVDTFYKVPKINEENYIQTVFDISENHNIDFIIPLTDPEVDVLSEARVKLDSFSTKLALANNETIKVCRNKERLSKYFANNPMVDVIKSYSINEVGEVELSYPAVAKPKSGRSSEGLKYIGCEKELLFLDEDYIIQPFIDGAVVTVDLVRDYAGNITSLPRKELIRTSNGAGLSVEMFQDKELEKLVAEISEELDIRGCMNVEFIRSDSSYYLMDINPRFSAGIGFSKLVGYDFVNSHVRVYLREEISPIGNFERVIAAKHYSDYILG